jgi:hypothetical protein
MLHQKTTQNAISAMSRLAELFEADELASSADIAKVRNLSQPLVAKTLTTLTRAGLITWARRRLPLQESSANCFTLGCGQTIRTRQRNLMSVWAWLV